MQKNIKISPSILSANFAYLGEAVKNLDAAGADYIHIDVMDGNFVPNITIGPDIIRDLRPLSKKIFDVHLMVREPDQYIDPFAEAGADIITIHIEAGYHPHRTLQRIKALGKKAGIALNPATPVSMIEPLMDHIDLILIMSVNPGFGGQKFIPYSLDKVKQAAKLIETSGRYISLSVDGGVTKKNAPDLHKAGADIFVAGSAIFGDGTEYFKQNIKALRPASKP